MIGVDGPEPSEAVQPEGDYYSLTLDAGQSLTLALKRRRRPIGEHEAAGRVGHGLSRKCCGATNVDQVISDFVAPVAGTYFVRVTGTPKAEYSLVATRDASFDTENNNDPLSAQSLDTTGVALGYVSAIDQLLGADDGNRNLLSVDPNTGASTIIASNVAGGRGYYDLALNPVTGDLYGSSECCGYGLYAIDASSFAETYIGDLGGYVGAMAWSPDGATLYGFRYSQFGTIDPATAAFTPINDPGIGYVGGMAFQPGSGTLYVVSNDYFGSLYTLDPATGPPATSAMPAGTIARWSSWPMARCWSGAVTMERLTLRTRSGHGRAHVHRADGSVLPVQSHGTRVPAGDRRLLQYLGQCRRLAGHHHRHTGRWLGRVRQHARPADRAD